jgi:hypothetical protein
MTAGAATGPRPARARREAPRPSLRRVALLMLAAVSLVAALAGALALLGVPSPPTGPRLAASHGLLMALGFLGTLVALERAVALDRAWAYLAPAASGIAGLLLIDGGWWPIAMALLLVASLVYLAVYVELLRMDLSLPTAVQAAAGLGWLLAAAMLVAGRPIADATPAITAFLVLTVAGERLELARLGNLTVGKRWLFVAAAGLFAAGVALAVVQPNLGLRLAGIGLVALAAWLAVFDIARRTVRIPGVTRFIALCLLSGYAWLAVGGVAWAAWGIDAMPLQRDAMLHAIFLGFVISMVFGHAPVILPAVLQVPLPYHPWFYGHLLLLEAGLLVRVIAGDALGQTWGWQVGGVLTVLAILLFLASSVVSAALAMLATQRAEGRAG